MAWIDNSQQELQPVRDLFSLACCNVKMLTLLFTSFTKLDLSEA